MIAAGTIENSTSQWNHRFVLVRKADGSGRLTLDLKKLNDMCRKHGLNPPKIEDVLGEIHGSI